MEYNSISGGIVYAKEKSRQASGENEKGYERFSNFSSL